MTKNLSCTEIWDNNLFYFQENNERRYFTLISGIDTILRTAYSYKLFAGQGKITGLTF